MSVTHVAAPMTDTELDQLSLDTIRTLSIDAVQQAKLGAPPAHRWRSRHSATRSGTA